MLGSQHSPPAFQWDDWYHSIGGRQIKISEVDQILQQIKEFQFPRFKGEVAQTKTEFIDESDAAQIIKQKGFEMGADEIGIAEIEPTDIYRGREVNEKYAIVVGKRMLWRKFQEVPSHESAIECLSVYFTLGYLSAETEVSLFQNQINGI